MKYALKMNVAGTCSEYVTPQLLGNARTKDRMLVNNGCNHEKVSQISVIDVKTGARGRKVTVPQKGGTVSTTLL